MRKLVSVILPVYNGEKYLSLAIESIINQTYSNWELIIINDCSSDNSLKIAEKYSMMDDRIHVYSNKVNLKLPGSLNYGFSKALGTYYTWTSDDNIFKPEALDVMVKSIECFNSSMVYADYSLIDEKGELIKEVKLQNPNKIVIGNIIGACFLYKSEIAHKIGDYNESLFLAEDYDYWIRIMKYGKVTHIDNNLYFYRIHPNSLTETKKVEIKEKTREVLIIHFLFLHKLAKDSKLIVPFFDFFIQNTSDDIKEDTISSLVSVDRWYGFRLNIRKIKQRFLANKE